MALYLLVYIFVEYRWELQGKNIYICEPVEFKDYNITC